MSWRDAGIIIYAINLGMTITNVVLAIVHKNFNSMLGWIVASLFAIVIIILFVRQKND